MLKTLIAKYGELILKYIWVPVIVPIFAWVIKIIICDRFLYVKEIKKITDNDAEQFAKLYNERIDASVKICVEEILQFIGRDSDNYIDHHLYICKKLDKTVGFIKFMVSKELHYIFIAYVAIDKNDKIANACGLQLLSKKIMKKYFRPQIATFLLTETEQSPEGSYRTALSLLVARYAKMMGKKCYYIDFPYIQPKMPDDNNKMANDKFLSLLYIPYYKKENNYIAKTDLLRIVESIYLDIYGPSCDPSVGYDCDEYVRYLSNLLSMYQEDTDECIKLVELER